FSPTGNLSQKWKKGKGFPNESVLLRFIKQLQIPEQDAGLVMLLVIPELCTTRGIKWVNRAVDLVARSENIPPELSNLVLDNPAFCSAFPIAKRAGKALEEMRKEADKTIEDLISGLGLSQSLINGYQKGRIRINVEN